MMLGLTGMALTDTLGKGGGVQPPDGMAWVTNDGETVTDNLVNVYAPVGGY